MVNSQAPDSTSIAAPTLSKTEHTHVLVGMLIESQEGKKFQIGAYTPHCMTACTVLLIAKHCIHIIELKELAFIHQAMSK